MINLGKIQPHKDAIINGDIIKSKSQYPSAGFLYKIKMKNVKYRLYVQAKLLKGNKAFIYCETEKERLIPRSYIIRDNSLFEIDFEGRDEIVNCGILFWSSNVEYSLRLIRFEIEDMSNIKNSPKVPIVKKPILIHTVPPSGKKPPIIPPIKNTISIQTKQLTSPRRSIISNSKFAYISNLEKLDVSLTMLVQKYIVKYISNDFDIVDIREMKDLNKYKSVILDHISIHRGIHKFDEEKLNEILKILETFNGDIYYMGHDEHNWSFNFVKGAETCRMTSEKSNKGLYPLESEYTVYPYLFEFFKRYNISYYISMCDSPELKYIYNANKKYKIIKDFYVLPHHIDIDIFKPLKVDKDIDILIYGWTDKSAYYFRWRMTELIKKMSIKVQIIPRYCKYNQNYCEEGLCKWINRSWLVLGCTDNFNLLERKFLEISASNSVILGNMNQTGMDIWKNRYIHVDNNMSDNEIIDIIKNTLHDKQNLYRIMNSCSDIIKEYSFNKYSNRLLDIVNGSYITYHPNIIKTEDILRFGYNTKSNYEADIYVTGVDANMVNRAGSLLKKYIICKNHFLHNGCAKCQKIPNRHIVEHISNGDSDKWNCWRRLAYNKYIVVIGDMKIDESTYYHVEYISDSQIDNLIDIVSKMPNMI